MFSFPCYLDIPKTAEGIIPGILLPINFTSCSSDERITAEVARQLAKNFCPDLSRNRGDCSFMFDLLVSARGLMRTVKKPDARGYRILLKKYM
jgi:hypothetical protein